MKNTMKAILYRQYSSPPQWEIGELPVPDVKPNEVMVQVQAASLNQMDLKIFSGAFRWISGNRFPKQVGADFSGVVVAKGEYANGFQIGDEVFGYLVFLKGDGGTFAEYVVASVDKIALKPPAQSHTMAAALPCVYQTALQGLRDAGRVKAGSRVLLYGASGGVGTAAIQLAKHLGTHVTTVSSSRNVQHCLNQGADEALAYDTGDIWEKVLSRYDLIFQVFETEENLYAKARKYLTPTGRFIVSPNPKLILRNILAILSGKFKMFAVKGNRSDLEIIAELATNEFLTPTVQAFDLLDYKAAMAKMAGFKGTGKVVLKLPHQS